MQSISLLEFPHAPQDSQYLTPVEVRDFACMGNPISCSRFPRIIMEILDSHGILPSQFSDLDILENKAF